MTGKNKTTSWPPWSGPTPAEAIQLCGRLATLDDVRGSEIVSWLYNETKRLRAVLEGIVAGCDCAQSDGASSGAQWAADLAKDALTHG